MAVAIASVTVMRGKERLAVVTVVATSGLFAFLSGTAAGLSPGIGIRCTFRELWAAAIFTEILPNSGTHATTVGAGGRGESARFALIASPGAPHAEGLRSGPTECYSQPAGGGKKMFGWDVACNNLLRAAY